MEAERAWQRMEEVPEVKYLVAWIEGGIAHVCEAFGVGVCIGWTAVLRCMVTGDLAAVT